MFLRITVISPTRPAQTARALIGPNRYTPRIIGWERHVTWGRELIGQEFFAKKRWMPIFSIWQNFNERQFNKDLQQTFSYYHRKIYNTTNLFISSKKHLPYNKPIPIIMEICTYIQKKPIPIMRETFTYNRHIPII